MRDGVAQRLVVVQEYLRKKGYGLKIWDAYRPQSAQEKLWQLTHNRSFVADPKEGRGSMHIRGAAVDATLVDSSGSDVPMPTDFDSFTPAALLEYSGRSPAVRENLKLLQKAMAHGGFYGLRTEWWHFCAPDWKKFDPVPDLKVASAMIEAFLRDLQQPEYLHVLLNPIPLYGLAFAFFGLIAATYLRSRGGQLAALVLVFASAIFIWPVTRHGDLAYNPVLSMADEDGQAWLKAHVHRADQLIWLYYTLGALAAAAIFVPKKWPRTAFPAGLRHDPVRHRLVRRRHLHRACGRQNSPPRIS